MVLTLLVNIMMAVLLLVTIVYCGRLNKRIRVLQDSKGELARIIREFNESTERATQSIADIHAATSRLSENIQHKIDKANFLATDLEMMIEKGNRMAGKPAEAPTARPASRPVETTRPARSEMEAVAGHVAGVTPLAEAQEPAGRRNRPRSRAEQELMSMLTKNEGR